MRALADYKMLRKALVVGDTPVPGGTILSYDGPLMKVYGNRIALIGGRAYCAGCNSVGLIAKAGVSCEACSTPPKLRWKATC